MNYASPQVDETQRMIGGGRLGRGTRFVKQKPVRLQSITLLTSNEGIVLRR